MSEPRPTLDIYGSTGHGHDEHRHSQPVPWKLQRRPMAPITVVIPSIPPRIHTLNRLLKSIQLQTLQPERIVVQVDNTAQGAWVTRDRGLRKVETDVVTFMDDDDYMGKDHLAGCYESMQAKGVDYVYPWFTIAGPSKDPFESHGFFGRPWSNDDPHQTTIVTMVRTELAQRVGFRAPPEGLISPEGYRYGEDYQFTLECMQAGARIYHYPFRTWYWVVTGANTSGRPDKWT